MCKNVRGFSKSVLVSILCLLAASVVLFSCSNLFDDVTLSAASTANSGNSTAQSAAPVVIMTGTLRTSLSDEGAVPAEYAALIKEASSLSASSGAQTSQTDTDNRSARPEKPSSVTYEIKAETVEKAADGTTPLKTADGTPATSDGVTTFSIPLASGYKWKITVTMKATVSGTSVPILSDTYTMESVLAAGSTLSHDFLLKPVESTSGGSISLTFSHEGSDSSAVFDDIEIASVKKNGVDVTSTWDTVTTLQLTSSLLWTWEGATVSPGVYVVTLNFKKGTKYVYYTTQTLTVLPNMTTSKWVSSHVSSGAFHVTQTMINSLGETELYVGANTSQKRNPSDNNPGTPYAPFEHLSAALEYIETTGDSTKDYTIHISGTQTVSVSIDSSYNDKMKSLTLCGMTGNTTDILYGTASGTVLVIATTKPVTIKNLKITNGNAGYKGGGIQMSAGTDVTLGTGALITGNRAFQKGGGVYVEGTSSSKAKLTIENGAEISANTLTDSNTNNGGFGLYADYAIISMTGGSICNHDGTKKNDGTSFSSANIAPRGTVRLKNTQFTMSGGKITGNKVMKIGGNLFVDANTQFTIDGGEISYGTIENDSDDSCGAGMWIQGESASNQGTVTLKSGKIIGNVATSLNPSSGGGVFVYNNGCFIMEGGEISGNSAVKGGAVLVATNGEFKISASAYIPAGVDGSTGAGKNDVYLDTNAKITISGALTPPSAANGKVATILPASYARTEPVLVLSTNPAPNPTTTLAAEHTKFSVIDNDTTDTTIWTVNSDGELCASMTAGSATSAISSMTASGTVTVTGEMNATQLSAIKDALTELKTSSPSAKVTLDLSNVTGITSLPNECFQNCSNIESIVLPEGVTSIGQSAFKGCSNLESVTLPQSLTTIGGFAFDKASKLESINIPASVESIGSGAFASCTMMTELTVDENNSHYAASDSVLYNKDMDILLCRAAGLTSEFIIPESVTTISAFAFHGTESTTITIPATVTTIGSQLFRDSKIQTVTILAPITYLNETFYGCSSLASIELPDTITSIAAYTFIGCTSLENIVIPASVETIGARAFESCTSLKTISFNHSNAALTIAGNAFYDCSHLATVNYLGSEAQKDARTISIGSTGNDSLSNATWIYWMPAGTEGSAGTSGTYVQFGEFPQTIKASGVTVDETQTLTRGSFTYYKGSDGAWYAKVSSNYYKVEPIKWRVVTTSYDHDGNSTTTGKKLLLAENILMGRWFDDADNTYATSEVYYYISDAFLDTAFTSSSQDLILTTTVDSVSDKIFLLSSSEAENTSYFSGNSSRIRMPTDFAKANGAQESLGGGLGSWWWLRTASSEGGATSACDVHSDGSISHYSVSTENGGVVPALCLNN